MLTRYRCLMKGTGRRRLWAGPARFLVALVTAMASLASLTAGPAVAGPVYKASDWCTDGVWQDITVLGTPVTLGVEVGHATDGEAPPRRWVTVCWSTSSVNDTSSGEIAGGYFKVFAWEDGWGYVECDPDWNALIKVACFAFWTAPILTDQRPGPGTTVEFRGEAQGILIEIAPTGAELGDPRLATSPTVSAAQSGTCLWVFGNPAPLPTCNATAAEAHAEPSDVVPAVTTAGPAACVGIYAGGTCVGTWVTVPTDGIFITIGADPDQTAGFTALGIGTGVDPGRVCIGTSPC